jgi:ketosteroid isomerase-like protein
MSQENVAVIRRLHDAYGRSALEGVIDEIFDPACEWHASEAFGVLRGPTAVLEYLNDFATTFDEWKIVATELIDAGDNVIGVQHASGIGKASGVDLEAEYAIVYSLRGNRIALVREYPARRQALEAVGLEV